MSLPHPELRVEIRKLGNKYFAVTKQGNGQEVCTNEFQHDPTGTTHLGPLWLLERGALSPDELSRSGALPGGRASEGQVAAYGQRLYTYLFGKAKKLQAFLKANPDYRQAHLTLSLHPDVASLWRLPWEYIHDGDDFVCLNGELRLSRLPEDLIMLSLPPAPSPLRVLFVIAAPEDQKALDVERELTVIQDALEDHICAGHLVMDVLDEATLPALQDALRRQPYHVLHYVGHGTYTYKQQRGFLCFEKRSGETELVGAEHLKPVLDSAVGLRMIVAAACQSAQIGVLDAFDSVASGLLQFGVPAVLTAPTSLSDDSAIVLLHTFYGQLAEGQPLVASLYDARLALKEVDDGRPAERRRFDWGVPALYLRAQDTRLVDPTVEAALATPASTGVRNIGGLALPHHFVDRRPELHTLRHAQQDSIRVLSLWGDAGSGKSALAAEFIAYSGLSAEDILIIGCRELIEPAAALEKIAEFWRSRQTEACITAATLLLDSRRDPAERARAAAQMVDGRPALIVFDDLDAWFETTATPNNTVPASIADKVMRPILHGLIAARGNVTYLFITNRCWSDVAAIPAGQKQEIHVTMLTPRHAVLLMNTLPRIGKETLTAKLDVYRLLSGHPETLKLLDGWLATGHSLQDLRNNPPVTPHDTAAWQQYFLTAILNRLDPGENDAVITMAVYGSAFSADLLTRLTRITDKYALPLLERWEKFALVQPHHIENGALGYSFHPVVRDRILESMSDDARAVFHTRIAAHYGAPFMDEARRRIVARNVTTWSEERLEWLARDGNGILGMWVRQTQNPEHARRAMSDALAWQYHLFKAGKSEAAAHIVRTIVPVLNRWGQHDLSEALLQRNIAVSAGPERAPSMDDLATLYLDRGHLDEALSVYEEVYHMLEAQGAKEQTAHILRRIAGTYQQLGDGPQAIQKYEAALQMMREIGNENGEGLCLYQLSALHRQMGDYARALMCSQAAEALYSKLGNRAGAAAALYEQAISLKRTGRPDQALEHLRKSFEITREIGDEALAINVLQEISLLHRDSGRLDAAIEASRKAVELCNRVDARKVAPVLEYLEKLYAQRGDTNSAAASYGQAGRIAQQ